MVIHVFQLNVTEVVDWQLVSAHFCVVSPDKTRCLIYYWLSIALKWNKKANEFACCCHIFGKTLHPLDIFQAAELYSLCKISIISSIYRCFWANWCHWWNSPTLQKTWREPGTFSLVRRISLSCWWYFYQTKNCPQEENERNRDRRNCRHVCYLQATWTEIRT